MTNTAVTAFLHGTALRYGQIWTDPSHHKIAALKRLWLVAYREAEVQSFADAYLAIAACLALAFVMVPLMRKVVPPSPPAKPIAIRPAEVEHG